LLLPGRLGLDLGPPPSTDRHLDCHNTNTIAIHSRAGDSNLRHAHVYADSDRDIGANADAKADRDVHADALSYSDRDSRADQHGDLDTHRHRDGDDDADTHDHSDHNWDGDAYSDADPYPDGNRCGNAYGYADGDPGSAHKHTNAHEHPYTHPNRGPHGDAYRHGDERVARSALGSAFLWAYRYPGYDQRHQLCALCGISDLLGFAGHPDPGRPGR